MPHVRSVSSSERVMRSRYGRTVIADSTPTNTFAEPESASAPDSARVRGKRPADARHAQRPVEWTRDPAPDRLHDAQVVERGHERREEDHGGQDLAGQHEPDR